MDLEALTKLNYGLYVVGTKKENKINALVANTVIQTSAEPATISVCLNKDHYTTQLIKESKVLTISILAKEAPLSLIGNFGFQSGRNTEKFNNIEYKLGKTGAPILLEHTLGYIEAKVVNSVEVETHNIFICKIKNTGIFNQQKPMTYDYYHQVKNGTTPESAPNYIATTTDTNQEDNTNENQKYQCSVCGYIYEPAQGDPEHSIDPHTPFKDLPKDWVCPLCGVGKDKFNPINQ